MRRRFFHHYWLLCLLPLAAALPPAAGCRKQPPEPPAPCQPCVLPDAGPVPLWIPIAGRVVILDPGHGGKDPGTSHFGLIEKDINLDLALRTAGLLRARGVDVLLTREGDVFIPLPDRSAFANARPDATFVSIHVNASDKNPEATGIETFVLTPKFTDDDRSRAVRETFRVEGYDSEAGRRILAERAARCRRRGPELAGALQRSLTARLAERDRGVKTANLAVLRETYFCTAVLVETGFVSNPRTAERMATEEWRRTASEALAEGIVEFLRQPLESP